ncbi:MAG: hypothetical protein NTY70_03530 [Burkholderiales bacterium]|nr:hypothetical protein [Burkholderiales bacterium]
MNTKSEIAVTENTKLAAAPDADAPLVVAKKTPQSATGTVNSAAAKVIVKKPLVSNAPSAKVAAPVKAASPAKKAIVVKAVSKPAPKAVVKTPAKAAVNAPAKAVATTPVKAIVKVAAKAPAKAPIKAVLAAKPATPAKAVTPVKTVKPAVAKPTPSTLAKEKAKKEKLVRDSFTMPEPEYAVLGQVKKACLAAGVEVKKSQLLRVGLLLLSHTDVKSLAKLIANLAPLKAGRPKKEK